jgi:hypothetical protein
MPMTEFAVVGKWKLSSFDQVQPLAERTIQLSVKVVETGSFTKAGQELNMTQPAVSRAISSLESELDVILIFRDRRNGLILTDIRKKFLLFSVASCIVSKKSSKKLHLKRAH